MHGGVHDQFRVSSQVNNLQAMAPFVGSYIWGITVPVQCHAYTSRILFSSTSQYRFTNVNTVFTCTTQWSHLECSMSPTCPIIFSIPILAVVDEALTATFGMKAPPDWSQAISLLVYACTDHLSYDCRRTCPDMLPFGPLSISLFNGQIDLVQVVSAVIQ